MTNAAAVARAARQDEGRADKLRDFREITLRIQRVLTPRTLHLFETGAGSARLLDLLEGAGLMEEACVLMSFALPEREAVWWACMCVRHIAADGLPPEQQRALAAAESWVRRPDRETRALALAAYKVATPPGFAAMTAKAAYAAQLANAAAVNASRRVEIAVRRAAEAGAPVDPGLRRRRFLASGRDIATGGSGRLPPEAPTASARTT